MLALSFSLSLSLSLSPSLCFSVPRCRSLPQPPSVHSAGSMYILYPWVNTFILMHACAHYTGVRVRARMQIGAFDRVGAKSHPWRHSKIPFFRLALFIFPPLTLFSRFKLLGFSRATDRLRQTSLTTVAGKLNVERSLLERVYVLVWQLSDCGFCQYHLMRKSAVT